MVDENLYMSFFSAYICASVNLGLFLFAVGYLLLAFNFRKSYNFVFCIASLQLLYHAEKAEYEKLGLRFIFSRAAFIKATANRKGPLYTSYFELLSVECLTTAKVWRECKPTFGSKSCFNIEISCSSWPTLRVLSSTFNFFELDF